MKNKTSRWPTAQKVSDEIPEYITINQAALNLKVSEDFVRQLLKKGLFEGIKLPGGRNSPVRISIQSFKKVLKDSAIQNNFQPSKNQKRRQKKVYSGVFSE
jgi:hypothetical protein